MLHGNVIRILKSSSIIFGLFYGVVMIAVYYSASSCVFSEDTVMALNFIFGCTMLIIMGLTIRKNTKIYHCILIFLCSVLIVANKLYLPKRIKDISPLPIPIIVSVAITTFLIMWVMPYLVNNLINEYVQDAAIEEELSGTEENRDTSSEEPHRRSFEKATRNSKETNRNEGTSREKGKYMYKPKMSLRIMLKNIVWSIIFFAIAGIIIVIAVKNGGRLTSFESWSSALELIIRYSVLVIVTLLIIGAVASLALRICHTVISVITTPKKDSSDLWIYISCPIILKIIASVFRISNNSLNDFLNRIVDDGLIPGQVWSTLILLVSCHLLISAIDIIKHLNERCGDTKKMLEDTVKTMIVGSLEMIMGLVGTIFGDSGIRTLFNEDFESYVLGEDNSSPDSDENDPEKTSGNDNSAA